MKPGNRLLYGGMVLNPAGVVLLKDERAFHALSIRGFFYFELALILYIRED